MGERIVRNDEAGGSIPPRSTLKKPKSMYRFYCADANFSKSSVTITEAHEVHHIKDVLRLKKGSLIQIFNDRSQEADTTIEEIRQNAIIVGVKTVRQKEEGQARIILACAPPKKGKFEFIIEKCTELGVDEIIPLRTKRTEVVFKEDKWPGKLSRFEKVAVNASKQSKRTKVPRIYPMASIPEALRILPPNGLRLIPSLHDHPKHICEALLKADRHRSVALFIGPEGDFTPDELSLSMEHGCVPVSLGDTVLKVETAAIAAVALVKFLIKFPIPFGIDNITPDKV